jgi:murein DD-endopeptidase MepM/ murein hydrolase activator NlpD
MPEPDDVTRQPEQAPQPIAADPSDDATQHETAGKAEQSPLDRALAMTAHDAAPVVHHHFSDGPRAVPRTRGASLARAQALGIGGHAATRQLLWTRPGAALMLAVPGKAPKALFWPVAGGTFGRGFGYTRKIRVELRHNGLDIGAPEGAPVRAAAEGLVIYSDNTLNGFGNAVMILHPGGWTTLYGHCQRNTVQPGYYVKRGERIALVGHTGMAWGPHLHFELRDNGRWRDPEPLLAGQRDLSLSGPLVELSAQPAPAPAAEPTKAEPGTRPKRGMSKVRVEPHGRRVAN